MNRDQFHVFVSGALASGASRALGMGPEDTYRRSLLFARACGMSDWCDDEHIEVEGFAPDDKRTITQVQASRGIGLVMVLGNKMSRDYLAVHFNHFHITDQERERLADLLNRWATLTNREIVEAGWLTHKLEDCGFKGCPHWGYLGVPSPKNKAETIRQGRLAWYKRPLPASRCWGHSYDRTIDQIQNCREGAAKAGVYLFESISGHEVIDCSPEPGVVVWRDLSVEVYGERPRIESLIAISEARNDSDLAARSRRAFNESTEQPMPDFLAFTGAELDLWYDVVGGGR